MCRGLEGGGASVWYPHLQGRIPSARNRLRCARTLSRDVLARVFALPRVFISTPPIGYM